MRTLTFANGYTFEITRTRGIFGIRYTLTILAWGYKLDESTPLYELSSIFKMAKAAKYLATAEARG